MTTQLEASLRPVDDPDTIDAVLRAINDFDLSESSAWNALDALSTHTRFEELDADRGGIFLRRDDTIEVEGIAYVTLSYGEERDALSMSDSYPAKIIGRLVDGPRFLIDDVTVDTSSF